MTYDYDESGGRYAAQRRPDPRIAAEINSALGSSRTVLNVGAGTGSYEPDDRYVVAIEPSATMRAQRPGHCVPALSGTADSIPFDDNSFDAALAVLTVHHWPDPAAGLREMRRVVRGPVLVLSFDPNAETEFWLKNYVPEMTEVERRRYVGMDVITRALGGRCEIKEIPVRHDCTDKFQVALYARPEEFLKAEVRNAQSAWKFLPNGVEDRFVRALSADLNSGAWDQRYGALRTKPTIKCQLRLLVAYP